MRPVALDRHRTPEVIAGCGPPRPSAPVPVSAGSPSSGVSGGAAGCVWGGRLLLGAYRSPYETLIGARKMRPR